jgi:hypothetical protein
LYSIPVSGVIEYPYMTELVLFSLQRVKTGSTSEMLNFTG